MWQRESNDVPSVNKLLRRKMRHVSRMKDRRYSNVVQGWSTMTRITGMRSDVKCQRSRYNKVMSTVGCMFAHNSTTQKHRNWQEGCSCHDWQSIQVSRSKSQRSRSTGRLTPWPKISHIFGMGRPTNFKHTDGVQWPYINDMRGGLKGQRSITREGKVAETLKLAGRLSMPRLTFRTSSKIKRSKVKVTGPLLLAVQVTTCRDGDMWRPHYRPHSLYISADKALLRKAAVKSSQYNTVLERHINTWHITSRTGNAERSFG